VPNRPYPLNDNPEMVLDRNLAALVPELANGWVWYCDECESYGVADEEQEAAFMALAHAMWMERKETRESVVTILEGKHHDEEDTPESNIAWVDEHLDGQSDPVCLLYVWQVAKP
jgi:hypothetical protein